MGLSLLVCTCYMLHVSCCYTSVVHTAAYQTCMIQISIPNLHALYQERPRAKTRWGTLELNAQEVQFQYSKDISNESLKTRVRSRVLCSPSILERANASCVEIRGHAILLEQACCLVVSFCV